MAGAFIILFRLSLSPIHTMYLFQLSLVVFQFYLPAVSTISLLLTLSLCNSLAILYSFLSFSVFLLFQMHLPFIIFITSSETYRFQVIQITVGLSFFFQISMPLFYQYISHLKASPIPKLFEVYVSSELVKHIVCY